MSRQCMITGKKRMVGNNRSHALNATKRTFDINIQETSFYSETLKKNINVRASVRGIRTVEHNGGIDGFLAKTAKTKLDPALRPYKNALEKAKLAAKA